MSRRGAGTAGHPGQHNYQVLAAQKRLDDCHAFEADAARQALTEWAEANGLRVVAAG